MTAETQAQIRYYERRNELSTRVQQLLDEYPDIATGTARLEAFPEEYVDEDPEYIDSMGYQRVVSWVLIADLHDQLAMRPSSGQYFMMSPFAQSHTADLGLVAGAALRYDLI